MNVEKRNQITAARRLGMSPEAKARLDEVNKLAIWRGRCPRCKVEVRGTLVQVQEHRCDNG